MAGLEKEIEIEFKKAQKTLDGEKRAALKKAKGMKGKRSKEAVARVEDDFASRLQALKAEYDGKMASFIDVSRMDINSDINEKKLQAENTDETHLAMKERKKMKAIRKRERKKEKEVQQQKEIQRELSEAGPSLRETELDQIRAVLAPLRLRIAEVAADGHCMYRAVAAQANTNFEEIRELSRFFLSLMVLAEA